MPRRDTTQPGVSGIVLLDKPPGLTSNQALGRVKRIFGIRKAGHCGSLDPFASGMLPICLGAATKASAYLLASKKEYAVSMVFGVATDTGDIDGRVIAEQSVDGLAAADVAATLVSFEGDSQQVPPMYSALKHHGRRLYQLARAGIEVERQPRPICIDWIRLDRLDGAELSFTVRCSKGTYIRSLAVDIAAKLGTVGHVVALRRLAVDPFDASTMVDTETLEAAAEAGPGVLDSHLAPPDRALLQFPEIHVDDDGVDALTHGRSVAALTSHKVGLHRAYGPGGTFVGLADFGADSLLRPRRIFLG